MSELLMKRRVTGPAEIGDLTLVAGEQGLRAVLWDCDGEDDRVPLSGPWGDSASAEAILDRAESQLGEYFAGERQRFDLPLDPVGTEFQRAAWLALSDIPYGETRTYGEQAASLGRPSAARAVGAANGRNPLSIVVPCHRVVGANGSLTGFAAGVDVKRHLLAHEAKSGLAGAR